MESVFEEFKEVAKYYRQGKYQSCAIKVKGLLESKPESFNSLDDANIYNWIVRSNGLACDYMDIRTNGDVQNDKYISVQRSFHLLIKEWIYKSNKTTEIDLVLINNVLQCCSIFFHRNLEGNYCIYDNICCVIIALRKALSLHNGIDFRPPINICFDNPSFETVALIRDLIKNLPNFNPACRLILAMSLLLILQILAAANSSNLYKGWSLAVENLSFLLPDLLKFLEIDKRIINPKCIAVWTRPVKTKSNETYGMEIDFEVNSPVAEEPIVKNILGKIPLLTFNILGDAIVYQDERKAYPLERDITHHLLLTTIVINHLNGYSSEDIEIPSFRDQGKLSDCLIINAWKYIKGFSYYKNGKLKEAMGVMEELDLSSFSPHLKTKKALLTASILSKENSHMLALSTLNKEAMGCHDCLPISLYTISEEHGFLERKQSQLEALRLLFKVLKHRNHLESLDNGHPSMLLKMLDILHPLPKVTIVTALEKLASILAHNELYEESAERYLDLLSLLEKIGPAKTLLHTIHSAAAVLLLIVGKGGVDRSKDAATLCKRTTEIFSQNSDSLIAKAESSRPDSSENGSPASKRAKLEINVGNVFMELESGAHLEEKKDGDDLFGDLQEVDDIEVDIFENLQSSHISHDSIYSSLTSSRIDLMSTLLLSECSYRENDFHTSMLLLNRCLHILNKQQLVERSKVNSRDVFLKATDFIVSHVWLRKAKILMERESMEKLHFAKDIEHCFRNALIGNSDDAEIIYYYLKYMLAAGKIEFLNVTELTANVQFNGAAFPSTPPTERLAIWYIFRPTVTKDQYENLMQKIKESHTKSE